jgi:chromosome segregation ATPase
MSTKQELIDHMNEENTEMATAVAQKTQQKADIDAAIAQQQANIDYFNSQKVQCDVDITSYEANISLNNEIIAILEVSN